MIPAAVDVVSAASANVGFNVNFVDLPVGWDAYEEYGTTLPANTREGLADCDCGLLGPVLAGEYPDDDPIQSSPSGELRTAFDLYANERPVRSYTDIGSEGVDLVIVRQNTEGFYADRNMFAGGGEWMPTEDVVLSQRVVTRKECQRIAERAFLRARQRNADAVVAVHKANVFHRGDGMFLSECRSVADDHPGIELEESLVDAFAFELIRNPDRHRVAVTTNLFGDILSDEAAGVVGSLGLAPGVNVGEDFAIGQAAHGAAPDIAGDGIANPIAAILSAKLLLEWIGTANENPAAETAANRIEAAVEAALADERYLTPDLGGDATTVECAAAVVDHLE